jgi:hypothetical protein
MTASRHADVGAPPWDGIDRLAERDAGRRLNDSVAAGNWPDGSSTAARPWWNRRSTSATAARRAGQRRFHVDAVERREVRLQLRQDFQDHPVGIELGEILGDLALPKASLSVSSITWGVMPKREAWSRLMVTLSCGRIGEEVGRHVGELRQVRILASIFCDHSVSSAMLGSCSVYWKLPRAMRRRR